MGKKYVNKKYFLFLLTAIIMCSPLYCASKKKKNKNEPEKPVVVEETSVTPVITEDDVSVDNSNSIKLPSKKRTYFYKIDSVIVEGVEEGSPKSIKDAVSLLRQNAANLEENEKVLLYVATEIMKIAYPSESITWDVYTVENNNPYVGALSSVNQGIFDLSTGNVDFLTTLLPALVITKSSVKKSDYENCQKALMEAYAMNPASTLANYLLALLNTKTENYIEAERYLEVAYKNSPETDDISIAYSNVLRLNGKLDSALSVLSGVSKDSSSLSILKQNAYIAFDAKDLSKAELYVAKVLQQTPNDLEFLLFRARILIEKKDYIHAVSLLDMYARQDNSSLDYLVLRAKVQLDWSKNTAAATETVEKALQLYPDSMEALMFAARISSITDSPVAGKYADELAGLVLNKRPDSQEAMIYALDGLIQRENWQDAYNVCKELISRDGVDSDTVEKYVDVCIHLKKNSEAYEVSKRYYDANPDDEILMQAYIFAYCEIGSRDAVLKYIDTMMASATPKMKSYLFYRRSFLQLTEDNAFADLRSSLISNPRNSDSLFRLYELYYGKKDYRKAQYYLRQVVAINPNDNSFKQLNEALTKLIQ